MSKISEVSTASEETNVTESGYPTSAKTTDISSLLKEIYQVHLHVVNDCEVLKKRCSKLEKAKRTLLNKNHKLQTANSELYEQQKKLYEEITSLQSRLLLPCSDCQMYREQLKSHKISCNDLNSTTFADKSAMRTSDSSSSSEAQIVGDISASDNGIFSTMNRDVPNHNTVHESTVQETKLSSSDVHSEDHANLCIIEGSVLNCQPSTEELSPKYLTNDTSCSFSAEKMHKLKLKRGNCHYNETAEKSISDVGEKMSSADSKCILPDSDCHHAVSDKSSSVSVLNMQLLPNAASHVCQPSDVLVPETVPLNDDCIMTYAEVDHSLVSAERDSLVEREVSSSDVHVQPSTIVSSLEKTSPDSPVFNRQCAIRVPVSSSPSLFDDEEEKRLHQRNVSKNLSLSSEKIFATRSGFSTDVSQPSPVLCRNLSVSASAHPENEENKYNMNVVFQQPMTVKRLLQNTVAGSQKVNTVNVSRGFKENDDCTVQGNSAGAQNSEMLHNELDSEVNGAGDGISNTQMPNVDSMHANDSKVACDTDMLELSRSNNKQNDLYATLLKMSQHEIASATCSSSHVTCGPSNCQQPLPKKRRFEAVNNSVFPNRFPQSVNVQKNIEDSDAFDDGSENKITKTETHNMNHSFDRVPKPEAVTYRYTEVVRKQELRRKMDGFACFQCQQWFHGLGLSKDEIEERLKHCRHKAQFEPTSTPGHFWSVNFLTTQQCREQGNVSEKSEKPSRYRRKKGLRQLFSAHRSNTDASD